MFAIDTFINDVLFIIMVCLSQLILMSYTNDNIIFHITALCITYTILYIIFMFAGDEPLGRYFK